MDWFKHLSASSDDPDIQEAEDLFGDAGYSVFFKILEIYAKEYNHLNGDWLSISRTVLRRKLRKSWTKAEQILSFYQAKNRIFFTTTGSRVFVKVPKFVDTASNWTRRQLPKKVALPTEAPTEAPTKKRQTEEEGEGEVETRTPYTKMVDVYHKEACPPLPKMVMMYPGLAMKLDEWWAEYGDLERWDKFLKHVLKSDHLTGKTPGKWVPSLDWLVTAENLAKILNGKYHGATGEGTPPPASPAQDAHSKKLAKWQKEKDENPDDYTTEIPEQFKGIIADPHER